MKRKILTFLFFTLFLGSCGQNAPEQPQPAEIVIKNNKDKEIAQSTNEPSAANSFIVMFRAEAPPQELNFASFFTEYQHHFEILSSNFMSDPRIKDIQYIDFVDLSPRDLKGQRFTDFDPPNALKLVWEQNNLTTNAPHGQLARVDFADADSANSFLSEAETNGKIWYAEPNYEHRLSASQFDVLAKSYDGLKSSLKWHESIHLQEAMAYIAGLDPSARPSDDAINANPPLIAVLDTGLDYEHPAMKGRVWENGRVGAAGCENDLHGCDTANPSRGSLGNGNIYPCNTNGPSSALTKDDQCSHGTHVSGIIAANATSSSSSSVGGVCPVCQIMTIKVVELQSGSNGVSKPRVLDSAILTGMKYLNRFRRSGSSAVRVVNSSFGKFSKSRSVGILIDVLKRDGKGIILIGAAGNEDSTSRAYPAAFSQAVSVAALADDGVKARFSNYGSWVDIAAPGVDINSTVPGGGTDTKSGTSMACPVVAGAVGLYLAINPNATADQINSVLLRSADGSIYSPESGGGVNYNYYFPKFKGQSARIPLLGSGQLNVLQFLQNKGSDTYIAPPIERVTPGCGALNTTDQPNNFVLMILLMSPFVAIFAMRRRS